jgi:hypothetical protein
MLSVIYAECHSQALYAECRYAECRYAECRYAECRYAECRSARERPLKKLGQAPALITNIRLGRYSINK